MAVYSSDSAFAAARPALSSAQRFCVAFADVDSSSSAFRKSIGSCQPAMCRW